MPNRTKPTPDKGNQPGQRQDPARFPGNQEPNKQRTAPKENPQPNEKNNGQQQAQAPRHGKNEQ